jgi:HMG (high mobility group) box
MSAAAPQFESGGDGGSTSSPSLNANAPPSLPEGVVGAYGGRTDATMDAARLMMMQQQNPPHQSDALRRLSIDTIGSSQRSFGASGNPLRLQQQQQPRTTADWQLLLAQQQQQGGLPSSSSQSYSRAGNLALDPAAAVALDAAAQWRLQQQTLLGPASSLQLFGSQQEAPNPNNNALEMDLLYRTLLQQQQQQQQQSDTLLNLSRQQQLLHDFALQQNPNAGGGGDGLDPNHHHQGGGGNPFDLAQQYRGGLRQDPLDWSRNSTTNHPNNFDAATLLALQQQQQPLHFPQTSHATTNFNSSSRMALEEQLAMMNALQQQQQQNSLFFGASQQPHASNFSYAGGVGNMGHAVGGGLDHHQDGVGSASLLSALFAESAVPNLSEGHPGAAFHQHSGRHAFPSAASKKSKAAAANSEAASQLPVRALSAYNFFFRDERDRIISNDDGEDLGENEDPVNPDRLLRRRQAVPLDAAKKKQLLSGHWYRDRSVKRRHRKTHGKIAFTALSKVISQAWRDLPEVDKAFYRDVAAEDLERYQREVEQLKFNDAAGRPSLPPAVAKNESDDLEGATRV